MEIERLREQQQAAAPLSPRSNKDKDDKKKDKKSWFK